MPQLDDIHTIVYEKISNRFNLRDVALKHPLPERSWRMLGLVHIDGRICTADKFSRVLILKTSIAAVRGVRSVFLSPNTELDLPVFSSESMLMGKKRMFLVDVQRRGGYDRHDDTALYERLLSIRGKYGDLMGEQMQLKGEIQKTFSKAFCYVKITKEQDERALALFHDYLDVFLDMVDAAAPLQGAALETARRDYEQFLTTVIDHDPAVKIYKMFFGAQGGVERALDMFFGR